ncbi:MAG: hypothetical protein LBI28_09755 [Treponema sp.]|jgi:hypothetical protein|nr:hypothetical protein [Treponema sp.]
MKRFFVTGGVLTIALISLLVLSACTDPEELADTSELSAAIIEAYKARSDVENEAEDAADIVEGESYATRSQKAALINAISEAERVRDSRSKSQASVDAATAALRAAIKVFEDAVEVQTGTNNNIMTFSGTITIKENGQPVPYVEIVVHDKDWDWEKKTRVDLSEADTPVEWTIKAIKSTLPTGKEIYFRINAFSDKDYLIEMFRIDDKDNTMTLDNTNNKTGITINMTNLRTITLNGTINISHEGKSVPSVVIQAFQRTDAEDRYLLGETTVFNARTNTPWSIKIEALEEDTNIIFYIHGFKSVPLWGNDYGDASLFNLWYLTNPITVKNTDKFNINLNIRDTSEYNNNTGSWMKWIDSSSTATIDYSVDNDGVCAVTVGGTPAGQWEGWKAIVQYNYIPQAGKYYAYTFEAWTETGERQLNIQYYYEAGGEDFAFTSAPIINSTRTTYTLVSERPIPKGETKQLAFRCATQMGKFYIKIISITEVDANSNIPTAGRLTITGIPNEYNGKYICASNGWDLIAADSFKINMIGGNAGLISNGTVTLNVWVILIDWVNDGTYKGSGSFYGNNYLQFELYILNSPTISWDILNTGSPAGVVAVDFVNGIGSGTFEE